MVSVKPPTEKNRASVYFNILPDMLGWKLHSGRVFLKPQVFGTHLIFWIQVFRLFKMYNVKCMYFFIKFFEFFRNSQKYFMFHMQ